MSLFSPGSFERVGVATSEPVVDVGSSGVLVDLWLARLTLRKGWTSIVVHHDGGPCSTRVARFVTKVRLDSIVAHGSSISCLLLTLHSARNAKFICEMPESSSEVLTLSAVEVPALRRRRARPGTVSLDYRRRGHARLEGEV